MNKYEVNKYQEALSEIGNIVLDKNGDGYYTPKYLRDFYFRQYGTLKKLVHKSYSFEWIPFEMEDGFILCQIKEEDGFLNGQIPNVGEKILVTDGKRVWEDTWIEYDDGYALDSNYDLAEVTAWMPLPEPYKEKENE